jgi:hypothetical protein
MTKKQYIAQADAIKAHNDIRNARALGEERDRFYHAHIETLADFYAVQNPRFDRQLWLDYIAGRCGPNGEKVRK